MGVQDASLQRRVTGAGVKGDAMSSSNWRARQLMPIMSISPLLALLGNISGAIPNTSAPSAS
ncbi:hypothetical protein AB664_23740 [Brucella anthropi]|uniref:Uncharacterized protein n=1 Tax=Brucella anthropi TaxID=529 RepID=A0A656Z6F1_BRUAN|nr:hypothetical protein AB664_23740 [Brucella anthropi]